MLTISNYLKKLNNRIFLIILANIIMGNFLLIWKGWTSSVSLSTYILHTHILQATTICINLSAIAWLIYASSLLRKSQMREYAILLSFIMAFIIPLTGLMTWFMLPALVGEWINPLEALLSSLFAVTLGISSCLIMAFFNIFPFIFIQNKRA